MQKEMLTGRQAICMFVCFILGSSIIFGVNTDAEQDSWIALLLSLVAVVPTIIVYSRIVNLFPQKDFYEILIFLFGKVAGKTIIAIMTWYALHLCALVVRDFSEFIVITIMPETPQLPIMIIILIVSVYIAKSGITTLGKWSVLILPIVSLVIILTTLISLNNAEIGNLFPVMSHSWSTLSMSAFKIYSFPFAETVVILSIAKFIPKKENPYKIYFYSIFISIFFLLIIVIRNITTLGAPMMSANYFPSYASARILHIGDFLTRVEGSVSLNFVLTGITKIAVCLIATAKGLASLFNIKHENLIFPASFLALALCSVVVENLIDLFDFIKIYSYYAIPFQIIIPLVVWISAEIKVRIKKGSFAKLI